MNNLIIKDKSLHHLEVLVSFQGLTFKMFGTKVSFFVTMG